MKIEFRVDPERLTWDDMETIEAAQKKGGRPIAALKKVAAKVLLNGDGDFMDTADAEAVLGALTLAQMKVALGKLTAALKELQAADIPPASGGK